MSEKLNCALDGFIHGYIDKAEAGLVIAYDEDFPSRCIVAAATDGENVLWQPVLQTENNHFDNVQSALDLTLNTEYTAFFTRYWSDHLHASAPDGELTLLQVWNQDDFERLQQNLIGHVLMKRRLKQPETLFFALTDQEDIIISVENTTGNVVVEQVGKRPHRTLAPSLAEFLGSLVPNPSAAA
ncbi:SecY-interacting protein [Alteromonas oceanisediminis]|uniref:SecY-interacting protein n=1 Tax=Alteromonas oceanisediminis TaxID=2836180 RepID=UPI001BD96798|nr:SecY-interacting protein [Alteromonas oceanisediminis]MBT0585025.1 SecY-interacting protein [Alteromonas oceanisediminis]